MKKFVIGLGMVLMGTAVMAQEVKEKDKSQQKEHHGEKKSKEKSPEIKADELTQKMTKEYGLNEDQTAKIKSVNLNYFQKKAHHRTSGSENKTLNTDRDAQYKAIMTRDQFKLYNDKLEAQKSEEKAKKKADKEKEKQQKEHDLKTTEKKDEKSDKGK
jgi:hypothetical protein